MIIWRIHKLRNVRAILFLLFAYSSCYASVVPQVFLDRVVAIGRIETNPGPMHGQWIYEASGFLYGDFISKANDKENAYMLYLVTNRHVIEEHIAATTGPLFVKANLKSGEAARAFEVDLVAQGKPLWRGHQNPAIDLAVIRLNAPSLVQSGVKFDGFHSESDLLSRDKAKELGLSEGDSVFVLGFPMGIVGHEQNYVIVRHGVIARIQDTLQSPSNTTFLIDAFIFPGSSGSPVVLKPEFMSIQGTSSISQAYLLGVVKGYLPYIDVAMSVQTKRPRVTFEENSGLAEVIPAYYVEEAIKDYDK
jgi:S1-C subfamily serine protease